MKTTKIMMMTVSAAALGLAAVGCDSTSTCTDAGVCADGGLGGSKGGSTGAGGAAGSAGLGGAGGGGPTLYAVTPGTYCFEILAIAPGSVDGCMLDVAGQVSTVAKRVALPVTYYATATTVGGVAIPAGTIQVGTMGSLGRGVVDKNLATLLRDNMPAAGTCTWHQTDTSSLQLTDTNTFDLAVTETEDMFAAACAPDVPTGGTCTSTWKWTMKIMTPQTLMAATDCK